MQGPELGVQADDMDLGEPDREEKQEVLENKDVRFVLLVYLLCFYINVALFLKPCYCFHTHFNCLGRSTASSH